MSPRSFGYDSPLSPVLSHIVLSLPRHEETQCKCHHLISAELHRDRRCGPVEAAEKEFFTATPISYQQRRWSEWDQQAEMQRTLRLSLLDKNDPVLIPRYTALPFCLDSIHQV